MIAFGGLNWALDGSAAPVAAVLRLEPAMKPAGALRSGTRSAELLPEREIRFRDLTFGYPGGARWLRALTTVPARSSMAIVGQNGAGKTTLAKLLCRLYDPVDGAIRVDGTDLRDIDLDRGGNGSTARTFQDYIQVELTLRRQRRPQGAPDETVRAKPLQAGGADLADLDTILSRAYEGGTDLSGGQWQRVALLRPVRRARRRRCVVLLDEPTAQLDVRGEAEIFDRILKRPGEPDDDPHLAPVLDGAARRSHLRARAGARHRARDPRRADREGRPLPGDVRASGTAFAPAELRPEQETV